MAFIKNITVGSDVYLSSTGSVEDIISFETRQVFYIVNYVFLCSLVAFFGIGTNAINIIVFYTQGFQNTTTISFIALAVSDMCCLVTLQWFNICMNPLVVCSGIPIAQLEIHYLTGGWPHFTFERITGWITVYITAERCLCITAPLMVKRIITPKRATCTLTLIYVINILIVLPVYTTSKFGLKFYSEINRTLLGVIVSKNNEQSEGLVFILHVVLVLILFVTVTVLTTLLVIKLNMASRWRHQVTRRDNKNDSMTQKDTKTTRMVVMISGLIIVTYTPGIVFSLVTFVDPRIGLFGVYKNMFHTIWSFGFLFNAINSSFNIFMYYNMSSRYREIFRQIFRIDNQGNNVTSAMKP